MNLQEYLGRRRLGGLIAAAGLVAAGACQDGSTPVGFDESTIQLDAVTKIEVSDLDAAIGDRITLGLDVTTGEAPTGGVQGLLHFDASKLELVGQYAEDQTIVVLKEEAAGEVNLVAVNPRGIGEHAAALSFEVLGADYAQSLRFEPSGVADVSEKAYRALPASSVVEDSDLPSGEAASILSDDEWAALVAPGAARGPARVAGEADIYGDGTQDAAVNVFDVLFVANLSVGNTSAAECIIGTDSPDRDCVAVNVRPVNGGVGGTPPPGVEPSGARIINVFDVLSIALASVGSPTDVTGDPIPNAGGGKDRPPLADTVIINGPITITGARDFSADTLYILRGGFLIVGDELGASGTINFEPGTRFEGDDASAIIVSRNGQIFADGTAEAPITFTCELPAAGTRVPGCWGGVFIAGNAVINDFDAGLGAAPAIPGRNPAGGGNQKVGEGGALNYGGSNDADNSGTIRYATFSYGGSELAPNNELNNLSIGACGSGTILENIQVHAGLDDGLELFGGRCDVTNLLATANDDDQFDYSFGYDGDAQFIVIQQLGQGDKGFEVDNTEELALFDNQPRTGPRVYNVTMVGEDAADPTQGALRIRRGAGGELRNFLIIGYDDGFDPEEQASCDLLPNVAGPGFTGALPNILTLDNTVFLNVDDAGDSAASCAGGDAPVETYLNTVATDIAGGAELTNAEAGRLFAGELKAPFDPILPDFRPVGSGVASVAAAPASVAGIGAPFFGGVAPVGAGGSIPWYLGWSFGWQSPTVR